MKKKGIAVVLTIATLTSTLLGGCGVAKESTSTSDMSVVDYDSGSTMYDNAVATSEEEMTPDFKTEEYNAEKETGFAQTSVTPLSTFSADVDTASYSNLRRMIEDGYSLEEIPEGAVRIEEILNYFDYDYNLPEGEEPFGVTTEMSECPWNSEHMLLSIGLKTEEIDFSESASSNLVFFTGCIGVYER